MKRKICYLYEFNDEDPGITEWEFDDLTIIVPNSLKRPLYGRIKGTARVKHKAHHEYIRIYSKEFLVGLYNEDYSIMNNKILPNNLSTNGSIYILNCKDVNLYIPSGLIKSFNDDEFISISTNSRFSNDKIDKFHTITIPKFSRSGNETINTFVTLDIRNEKFKNIDFMDINFIKEHELSHSHSFYLAYKNMISRYVSRYI